MINTCYTLPVRHVRHIRRVLGRGIVSNFTTAPTEHAHFENVCAWAKCPIARWSKASLLSCSILDRGRRWNLSFKLLVTSYSLGPKQNYLAPSFCQASSLWFLVLSAPLMRGQVQTCAPYYPLHATTGFCFLNFWTNVPIHIMKTYKRNGGREYFLDY